MADTSIRILISAATDDIKKSIDGLKAQFADLGKTLGALGQNNTNSLLAGLVKVQGATQALGEATATTHGHMSILVDKSKELVEKFNALAEAAEFVGGGFLSIQAVGLVKDFLDVAARTDTLGVALKTIGQNAGIGATQLDAIDKKVQSLGISASASRQSLIELIQSGISTDLAAPLARASQDLAVIAGLDSSETFKRLVTNIQQLDSEGLRFMGIMVDREQVFQQAAQVTGQAITETAQRQVFANAVLAEAAKLTGTYEASMETAGKVLTSFPRIIEEFKNAIGAAGQGVFTAMVMGVKDFIEALTKLAIAFQEPTENVKLFGQSAEGAVVMMGPIANIIRGMFEALTGFVNFLTQHSDAVMEFGRIVRDVFLTIALGSVLSFAAKGIEALGSFYAFAQSAGIIAALSGLKTMLIELAFGADAVALSAGTMWAALLGPITLVVAAVGGLYALQKWLSSTSDATKNSNKEFQTQTEAVQAFVKVMQERIGVAQQLFALEQKIEDESFRQATAKSPDDKAASEAKIKTMREQEKALQDHSKNLIEQQQKAMTAINSFGKVPEGSDNEKAVQEAINSYNRMEEAIKDASFATKDLQAALTGLGSDLSQFGGGANMGLLQQLNNIRTVMLDIDKDLGHGTTSSAVSGINTVLLGLEQQSLRVHTQDDYDAFVRVMDEAQKKALETGQDISAPLAAMAEQLKIQVAKNTADIAAGGAAARAEQLQASRRQIMELQVIARQRQAEHQAELAGLKALDTAYYSQGIIDAKSYYAELEKEATTNLNDNLQLEKTALQQAYIELNQSGGDPARQATAERAIQQALGRMRVLTQEYKNTVVGYAIEEANKRIALAQQVAKTQNDLNTELGYKEESIRAAAALALQEQLKSIRANGTAEEVNLTTLKNRVDMEAKIAELKQTQLTLAYDNADSELQLQSTQVTRALNTGSITSLDAQQQQNFITQQRISLLMAVRDEQKKALDDLVAQGTYSVDTYNNIAKALDGTISKIEEMKLNVHSLGEELQKTFVDSFGNHLSAFVSGTEKLRDAVKGFFNDLAGNITKQIATEWAQNAVKMLNTKFGGQDGGFFDKVMSALTGKPLQGKPDGSSANAALYVRIAGNEKTGPEQRGVTIPDVQKTFQDSLLAAEQDVVKNTKDTVDALNAQAKAAADKATENQTKGIQFTGKPQPTDRPGAQPFPYPNGSVPAFNSQFDVAATKYGLDKYGLNGDALRFIAQHESSMNPNAVSAPNRNGTVDVGLMQINSDNIKAMGLTIAQMKDTTLNIDTGAKIFANELKTWSGDVDKALAAYNAGDSAVKRAMAERGDDWLNSSAISDTTRKYVRMVGTQGALGKQPLPIQTVPGSPLDVNVVGAGPAPTSSSTQADSSNALDAHTGAGYAGSAAQATSKAMNDMVTAYTGGSTTGTGSSGLAAAGNLIAGGAMSALTSAVPQLGIIARVVGLGAQAAKAFGDGAQKGTTDLATQADQGGLGLNSFFGAFKDKITSFFSGGAGSPGSGGGGLGGLFNGLFGGGTSGPVDLGTVTGADLAVAFADGGFIRGPGGPKDDSVAAYLSNGEFVVNAASTRQWLPLLHAINEDAGMTHMPVRRAFADGGLVGGSVSPSASPMGWGSGAVRVEMHVHAQDADSFRRSQDQIAAQMAIASQRAARRNGRIRG